MNQSDDAAPQQSSFWKSKGGLVAIAFLLIAAFLLLSEHRAHVLGYLPFLLLLACPLLHLFMHGGHGGHGGSGHGGPTGRSNRANSPPDGA
uniref:DUF2933 domain-containing protein n=1 Tax=Inquilinus sp. OTU3971 TaxID=3043855 RepID=UPI00313BAD02